MGHARHVVTVSLGLGLGCASRPQVPAPVFFVPCEVPHVAAADSMGRQVQASGFTFCLPQAWQPVGVGRDSLDPNRWQAGRDRLVWDTGSPPSIAASRRVEIVGSVATRGITSPPDIYPHVISAGCSWPRTTSQTIDSVRLTITQTACQGVWATTAWRTAPAIYVASVVHSRKGAKLMLAAMQTIRLSTPRR